MKHLHLNNSSKSGQDLNKFANQLLNAVLQERDGIITMSVDDGDGDVWMYDITVTSDQVKEVVQITEN